MELPSEEEFEKLYGKTEILTYKAPPSAEELKENMLQAFANMGLDTPEKRQEWYEAQKPIAILCERINPDATEWICGRGS